MAFPFLAGALALAAACTTGAPKNTLPVNTRIDSLAVHKARRRLEAYAGGVLMKTYTVQLGRNPVGHKREQGDDRTPEGRYRIDGKNPQSRYHKNLGISYPSPKDRATARRLGKAPGGDVKIHGFPDGVDTRTGLPDWGDWTWGCIAVTNQDMDELYEAVSVGAVIVIQP